MEKFKVRKEDNLEFIGQLIDIFEDFLDKRGIIIPNEERDDDKILRNLGSEDSANIYGDDYFTLENQIKETLQNWNVIEREDV